MTNHRAIDTAWRAAEEVEDVSRHAIKVAIEAWCNDTFKLRPLDEWGEEDGPVLWWKLPIEEPPWCGTPLDSDWPGYQTHWCHLPPMEVLNP